VVGEILFQTGQEVVDHPERLVLGMQVYKSSRRYLLSAFFLKVETSTSDTTGCLGIYLKSTSRLVGQNLGNATLIF
jgi:hypothetical protein